MYPHDRENYQLEPVATITDDLGNNTLYRDYRDYVNSAKIRNADTSNPSLNSPRILCLGTPH